MKVHNYGTDIIPVGYDMGLGNIGVQIVSDMKADHREQLGTEHYDPRLVPVPLMYPLEHRVWGDGYFCIWVQHRQLAIAYGYLKNWG